MSITVKDNEYIANTYARFPLEVKCGKGAKIIGTDDKKYIDLGSGIAVNTFGMCDDKWIEAVENQLHKFSHISNYYYSDPTATLAEMLCKKTGMKKVFFSNSGAEANECAIKAARKYAETNKGKDYFTIVTLENSFHGRTLTTLSATGQNDFHKDFLPLTDGFVHTPANCCESLIQVVNKNKCAAIMVELIQGEGGVNVLNKEFVDCIVSLCREKDILLIADEVQTGNGRTGKLYSYMNFGVTPDILTTAKGLGGGLPIGATLLGKKVKDIFSPGMNGSTFGGNPVCCAGAISILSRLDDKLLDEVIKKGEYIKNSLEGASGIKGVSGMGLMLGIETVKDAKEIAKNCLSKGVLVLTAKNKVRLLPPLNIEYSQLDFGLKIIKEECSL